MLTKTKIALAALLLAGSASLAVAQEADPNLLNRYPVYNGAHGAQDSDVLISPNASRSAPNTFQSAPVRLNQGGEVRSFGGGTDWTPSTGRPQVHSFHYDSAPLYGF